MSEDIIKASKQKLEEFGVNENDIVIIGLPEGVPQGSILVTIWPHYLSVARVKRVREGSIMRLNFSISTFDSVHSENIKILISPFFGAAHDVNVLL